MGYSIFDETMVDMPWPEIEKAAGGGAIVLLPVGIIEEHGPHMGLAVDTYAAYQVSVMARHDLEAGGVRTLIAPPYYWGVCSGTTAFPGTFSARPETMKALIYDIFASLHSWQFQRIFTVNWHADLQHCQAVLGAISEARRDMGIDARYILNAGDLRRFRLSRDEDHILIAAAPPLETPKKYVDVHAGSLETGFMVQYFPGQVNVAMAKTLKNSGLTFEDLKGLGRGDAETRKIIPLGYFGDPASYDAGVAKQFMEATAQSYAEAISGYIKK